MYIGTKEYGFLMAENGSEMVHLFEYIELDDDTIPVGFSQASLPCPSLGDIALPFLAVQGSTRLGMAESVDLLHLSRSVI